MQETGRENTKLGRRIVSGIMLTLLLIGMLALAFNIHYVKAEPKTWTVDDDGPADFSKIQDAINASSLGDTIYVRAGTYYENVVVNKTVSLVGDDAQSTIIDGCGSGHVVTITVGGVNLTGFTIRNSGGYPYDGIHLYKASYCKITGNNITAIGDLGILLDHSSKNIISGNNITNSGGIYLYYSSNNIISRNNIGKKSGGVSIHLSSHNLILQNNIVNSSGILLRDSSENTISGNNVINGTGLDFLFDSSGNIFCDNNLINNEYGVDLSKASNNIFYHNNFINNTHQIDSMNWGGNVWDNGYPSGGNYWSDFEEHYPDVKDAHSGSYQNETGSDGIWDHFYSIDSRNRDNYPLVNPCTPTEHDLVVSELTTLTLTTLGGSLSLNATVTNQGSSDETNVEFLFLINGTIVDSTTLPLLQAGNSRWLSYLWTPTAEGTYNVTAYARLVPGETSAENNQDTKFITIWDPRLGVKVGDWVKMDYNVTGSGYACPEWLKVEILSVEGSKAFARLSMHMSDGIESSENLTLPVCPRMECYYDTGGTFDTLVGFGFIISANSTVGDYVHVQLLFPFKMVKGTPIDGEITRTYAGADRVVVYSTIGNIGGRYGSNRLKYYWDKQTGVILEASATLDSMTVNAKVTETNMWSAVPEEVSEEEVPFWMQWWFYVIVAVVIVALVATVYLLKKRKPPTPTAPTLPMEE